MPMDRLRSSLTFSAAPAALRTAACLAILSVAVFSPAQPTPAAPDVAPQAQLAAPQVPPQVLLTEEALRQRLVGKALYLRGGYQENSLSFDEHGRLVGHSPQGSYTLSALQIDKLRLTKHKVVLEGTRYGLHFVGQLASEDPSKAVDRVRITPKKKVVKITIDREMVAKPKKQKREKRAGGDTGGLPEVSEADQLAASIAATPAAERPAEAASVTTTLSPAHAARLLDEALDNVFAQGLDERMMASLPDFWRLYYQAAATRSDYRPADPAVLRQNAVERKARLLTSFEPASNEFAQAHGVAGMALYHTVVGVDGRAGEIAVGRPIGFGLDENAVAAIRAARFEPALKDGHPVPVLLDLVVQFRIFSKRTAVVSPAEPAEKPAEPVLPGPYSLPRP